MTQGLRATPDIILNNHGMLDEPQLVKGLSNKSSSHCRPKSGNSSKEEVGVKTMNSVPKI